jgi:hypothetical protein
MSNMNGRYWIFAYEDYYPNGGLNDLRLAFNNIEEYKQKVQLINEKAYTKFEDKYDNYELLDTETHYNFHVRKYRLETMVKWIEKNT